jgi:hypothetical protein
VFPPPCNVVTCLVDVARAHWQWPSQSHFCPW